MRRGHKSTRKVKEVRSHESKYLNPAEKADYLPLTSGIENSEVVKEKNSFYDEFLTLKGVETRDAYNRLKNMYKFATGEVFEPTNGKHLDSIL